VSGSTSPTAGDTAPSTAAPATTSGTAAASLSAFVGSWSTHDGSITIQASGAGQLEWPGATPPVGVPQVAQITATAVSPTQATVAITGGTLVYDSTATGQSQVTYGPGSEFSLTTTSFGLDLASAGQHLYYFCTSTERESGLDQQYCGA